MARTRVDYEPDMAVRSGPALRAELRSHAARAASAARASAPVNTGRYRDSIRVEEDTTDRAVVRVVADAPHALAVESRTGNLARALGSVGG